MNLLRSLFAIALLCAGSTVATARADEPADANPLEPFARFPGGVWISAGKGPGDGNGHAKVVYEWGLNKRMLKAKSFFVEGDKERLIYESVFTYHPGKKTIVFWSVSDTGGLFDGTVEVEGDTFENRWTGYTKDKATNYRQTLKFVDDDNLTWTVFAQRGDDWVKVIDATMARQKSTKPAE